MDFFSLLCLTFALAMDATCVSMAKGMSCNKNQCFTLALLFAFFFGLFQAGMPVLGYWLGSHFQNMMESIDHWIAFILLLYLGMQMIHTGLKPEGERSSVSTLSFKTIIALSIATSIDAFAVGVSFAFLEVNIVNTIILIGCITFLCSFVGVYIGCFLGNLLQKYASIFGGVILIILGFKILIEHLFL